MFNLPNRLFKFRKHILFGLMSISLNLVRVVVYGYDDKWRRGEDVFFRQVPIFGNSFSDLYTLEQRIAILGHYEILALVVISAVSVYVPSAFGFNSIIDYVFPIMPEFMLPIRRLRAKISRLDVAACPLVGRQDELRALKRFAGSGSAQFLWWRVAGPLGIGKTRLVLEFLESLSNRSPRKWDVALLNVSGVGSGFSHWRPRRATALVIDDWLEGTENVIEKIADAAALFHYPVRLLCTDAHPAGIYGSGLDDTAAAFRWTDDRGQKTLYLGPLSLEERAAMVNATCAGISQEVFDNILSQSNGKPLLVEILASYFIQHRYTANVAAAVHAIATRMLRTLHNDRYECRLPLAYSALLGPVSHSSYEEDTGLQLDMRIMNRSFPDHDRAYLSKELPQFLPEIIAQEVFLLTLVDMLPSRATDFVRAAYARNPERVARRVSSLWIERPESKAARNFAQYPNKQTSDLPDAPSDERAASEWRAKIDILLMCNNICLNNVDNIVSSLRKIEAESSELALPLWNSLLSFESDVGRILGNDRFDIGGRISSENKRLMADYGRHEAIRRMFENAREIYLSACSGHVARGLFVKCWLNYEILTLMGIKAPSEVDARLPVDISTASDDPLGEITLTLMRYYRAEAAVAAANMDSEKLAGVQAIWDYLSAVFPADVQIKFEEILLKLTIAFNMNGNAPNSIGHDEVRSLFVAICRLYSGLRSDLEISRDYVAALIGLVNVLRGMNGDELRTLLFESRNVSKNFRHDAGVCTFHIHVGMNAICGTRLQNVTEGDIRIVDEGIEEAYLGHTDNEEVSAAYIGYYANRLSLCKTNREILQIIGKFVRIRKSFGTSPIIISRTTEGIVDGVLKLVQGSDKKVNPEPLIQLCQGLLRVPPLMDAALAGAICDIGLIISTVAASDEARWSISEGVVESELEMMDKILRDWQSSEYVMILLSRSAVSLLPLVGRMSPKVYSDTMKMVAMAAQTHPLSGQIQEYAGSCNLNYVAQAASGWPLGRLNEANTIYVSNDTLRKIAGKATTAQPYRP